MTSKFETYGSLSYKDFLKKLDAEKSHSEKAEHSGQEKLKNSVQDKPDNSGPGNPEKSGGNKNEYESLDQLRREADQGHRLRENAFTIALIGNLLVGILWFALLANFPEGNNLPKEYYYLWALKMSLSTVVLIAIFISTMRFAIRCYGHHQPQQDGDTQGFALLGKGLESVGKTINSFYGS